jgi:hypothetical protein
MYAYRSFLFQYKMIRLVQQRDHLSPTQHHETTQLRDPSDTGNGLEKQ